MRRTTNLWLAVLAVALPLTTPAAAQSDSADMFTAWGEEALAGSHFATAMERWVTDGMRGYALGLHLATMPGDSAAAYDALDAIAAGDFSHADDASLIQLFDLFERTLYVAPVPVCGQALGGNAAQAFIGMLASADSAAAEEWVGAFDALILGMIAPGKVSPPVDAEGLQSALMPVMVTLSPEQLQLWVRQAADPAALTEVESCEVARTVFATINRIPEAERAGVLRGSMMMNAGATEETAQAE